MNFTRLVAILSVCLASLAPHSAYAAAGDTEALSPNITGGSGLVLATAVQSNGMILIGGSFSSVSGVARNHIARLTSGGVLDPSFDPNINGTVNCIAVQPDGKILVGGSFGTTQPSGGIVVSRPNIARFNADGSVDTSFNPGVIGDVNALAIQPNGSILVAGNFTSIASTARNDIARVTSAGAIDSTFNPDANGAVHSVIVQPDGRIVLAGEFTTVGGTIRNRIARVESTGALDTTFAPNANDTVWCLACQPDGRILLGGKFTSVGGTTRNRFARIESTGALDAGFNPNADNDVYTIVLQADGKIIFGGLFLTIQPPGSASPINQRHIARLSSAGAFESAVDPVVGSFNYTSYVSSLTLQNDGKILLGGHFDYLGGATNGGIYTNHFGRLSNDAVTDTVAVPSASQVTWTRGGAAPELTHVQLERSTDLANWFLLGTMTRVSTTANWQSTGLSLPSTGYVRLRAQACGGFAGGSQSLVEKLVSYGGLSTSNAVLSGNGRVINRNDTTPSTLDHTDFGSVLMATTDSITRTFTIQNTGSATLTLGSVSAQLYAFNGSYPSGSGYDGAFTVTTQPNSSVAPGGVTTFTIRFDPSGLRQIGVLDYQVYFNTNDPIAGFGFNIRGTGLNTVPTVANPLPDQSINLGSAFNYTIPYATFSDADRNFDSFGFPAPAYTAAPLPGGVTLNATSGAFSGTPTTAGSTDITVTYRDSQNATVSDTFRLTVVAPNTRPTVATPIPDQTVTQGDSYSYPFPTNTFADADAGNVLTYSATGLPPWLAFNPATRTFSGTPGNSNVGFSFITVTATDNGSPALGISDSFILTVLNANDAPTVITPILDQGAIQGVAFSFTVPTSTFNDVDPDTVLSHSATGLPAWLSFNPATRTFSGTPGNPHVGFVDITITATDNGTPPLSASDVFRITVSNANDAPTVDNPIPDRTATQGAAFSYSFPANTFADIDVGDTLTYSVSSLPFWLTYNPATRTFSGTPGNVHVGFVDITVTATDNSFSTAADTFRITVANENDAPTLANPIPDQATTEDVAFSYTVPANTFADIDAGDVLTYSSTGLPAWLSFDPATRTLSGTPGDTEVGFVDVTVTATDNGTPAAASVSDSFRITIAGENDVPVFTKGADPSIPGGTSSMQSISGWATGIADGDSHADQSLVFLVASNDHPDLFTMAPAISSDGTLSYTPAGMPGTATIGVSIQDDATAGGPALTSEVQTFTITVTDTLGPAGGTMNLSPGNVVDSGADLTVEFGGWTDPNMPLSFGILVNDVLVSPTGPSSTRTFTAPTTPGSHTLKGRILDALGNETETSQSFTVLTALESWRRLHFGSPENSGDGGDEHDFDTDGVVNLVEFAFGMSPKGADTALLPQPQRIGDNLILMYNKPPGVSGITYGAEWSEDLAADGWRAIENTGTAEQPAFSVPTTNRARMFMRHVISSP